ncbi:MAG TPA: DUF2946 family protein [Allosphingosinicella sp.]|jgi:hypothetical protein
MLALLLAFRLLIPSGYMIASDHRGNASLALCGGLAPAAAQPAHHGGSDGHGADPAPSKPGERPCPYAALTAPPLPPAPPALPPEPEPAAAAADRPADADVPRVAPAAPPPPARGPPILV